MTVHFKSLAQKGIFIAFYIMQTLGSIGFLYWLLFHAWNTSAPLTSSIFFACEVIAFVSSTLFLFSGIFGDNNADTELLAETRDSAHASASDEENIPEKEHPVVAVCLCRYNEPVIDLLVTIRAILDIKWPAQKVRIYILDDGFWDKTEDERKILMKDISEVIPGAKPLPNICLSSLEEQRRELPRPDCATKSFSWQIRSLIKKHSTIIKNTNIFATTLSKVLLYYDYIRLIDTVECKYWLHKFCICLLWSDIHRFVGKQ